MRTTTNPDTEEPAVDPTAVCTLSEAEMARRLGFIRREILPHVIETVRMDRALALELAPAPGLAERLDRLIEAERECCPGIGFERVASERPDGLRFEIRGIDPDAAFFRGLGTPADGPSARRRLAKAVLRPGCGC